MRCRVARRRLAIEQGALALHAPPVPRERPGELADAWAPFLYPRSQLATGVERLREGATWGGHPDRLPEIHPCVPAVVADTDAKARQGAAWFVSLYVTKFRFEVTT